MSAFGMDRIELTPLCKVVSQFRKCPHCSMRAGIRFYCDRAPEEIYTGSIEPCPEEYWRTCSLNPESTENILQNIREGK